MFTMADLTAEFGISRTQIKRYVRAGVLPKPTGYHGLKGARYDNRHRAALRALDRVRAGRGHRYTLADLRDWLNPAAEAE